ncbi:cell division protein FtsA [Candidatus Woesebacteria bacterium]|nr:cell division protein FtsA [Candidatus Woesebacteria bacterium]
MARTHVIAGIDVGSSKISTLIAQHDEEEDKIRIVGIASVESKGVRKGQIVDIEEAAESVVDSVERAERMAGYSLDRAFVTIGGGHIESRNSHGVVAVADPSGEITTSDVERVIEAARAISLAESRDILHVLPREYKVDGETQVKDPQGMSAVRLEAETHLITGSSTAIRNIQKCVSEVGVDSDGLVFSGLASSLAVLSDTEKELGVVLVDIGGGTTSIAVYVEGAITYSSVLPIGGRNVTNDIAAGLRVSLEGAEKIKIALGEGAKKKKKHRKEGLGVEDKKSDELNLSSLGTEDLDRKVSKKTLVDGIIRPRLNEIFTMVGMELTNAEVGGKTPSGVVVTGGGANCIGVLDAAKRMLSLPARIGLPKGVTGLIDEVNNPVFAASVGLVLYGTEVEEGQGSWLGSSNIMSKFDKIPVGGIIGRAGEVFKKLLP